MFCENPKIESFQNSLRERRGHGRLRTFILFVDDTLHVYKPRCEEMGIEYLNIFYHVPNELSNRKYRYCFLSRSQRRDDDERYADDIHIQT